MALGPRCGFVSWSPILVYTEISLQLLHGLTRNFVQSQKDDPNHFGDFLTFHLAPSVGQSFHLSSKIFKNQPDGFAQTSIDTDS